MARGRPGAFGGRTLTSWPVWLAFSAVVLPRARKSPPPALAAQPRSPRPALVRRLARLLQPGLGLHSAPLAVPPLAVPPRSACVDRLRLRARSARRDPSGPSGCSRRDVFLVGLRVGLNVETQRSVIDVGYAGVIGADRILDGQAPYGHMPQAGSLKPCGPADANGEVRAADPGERALRGVEPARRHVRPGRLPRLRPGGRRARLVGEVGLAARGPRDVDRARPARRCSRWYSSGAASGDARCAATLAFAWAAYPFTAYALLANTNDALMPALLVVGLLFAASPGARGASVALAGWTKFAALLARAALADVSRTRARCTGDARSRASSLAFVAGHARCLLDAAARARPDGCGCGRSGTARSPSSSVGTRRSRSGTGASTTPAGSPISGSVQLVRPDPHCSSLAGVVAVRSRAQGTARAGGAERRDPARRRSSSLTHWFYLYLPWVLPFVVLALFLPRDRIRPARETERAAPRAVVFVVLACAMAWAWDASGRQITDVGLLPRLRRADRPRRGSRTATSTSSTRRARSPSSCSLRSSRATHRLHGGARGPARAGRRCRRAAHRPRARRARAQPGRAANACWSALALSPLAARRTAAGPIRPRSRRARRPAALLALLRGASATRRPACSAPRSR